MELNFDDPLVWDNWRESYSTMTDEEHLRFCNEAERRYPSQQHFTVSNFDILFRDHVKPGSSVIEIGGWKGELAKHCLTNYRLKGWLNVDFCQSAVDKTVPMGSLPYRAAVPKEICWFKGFQAMGWDVCVSSHTIEHLSEGHLLQMLDFIMEIPIVMFEAPIGPVENNWSGYMGTHILKMGWDGVNAAMVERGYEYEQINQHCFLYKRSP